MTSTGPELSFPPQDLSAQVKRVLLITIGIGVAAFLAGLMMGEIQRMWQIYFVNFLFWSGIAQGGIAMAGVYRMTNARWGDHFRRIGESMISFLPVSFVLYLVLIAGGRGLFPWLHEPMSYRQGWFDWLFVRDGIAFLILFFVSFRFVYHSIRPDLGLVKERWVVKRHAWFVAYVTKNWRGYEAEKAESTRRLARMTPILLITFAVLYSLIGFDLVMGLDPRWFSTLFGWLYFLHAFFAALVMITILAVLSSRWFTMESAYAEHQWHDMGRFVFGFCLLSGGFFWSQFLVIWYGNLPEETSFLIKRFYSQPWEPLMWVYLIFAYLFPLAVFLSRRVKQVPRALLVIVSIILVALFIERFIAVVPFLWNGPTIPFGGLELLVTLAFGAGFVVSWGSFVSVVPIVPPGSAATHTH